MYDLKYKKEKNIVAKTIKDYCNYIENMWKVDKPDDELYIYIFKSDLKYIYYAFPVFQKILIYTILFPYWFFRIRKSWSKMRTFYQYWNGKYHILLRPIESYKKLDSSLGELMLIKEEDRKKKFEITFFHIIHSIYINDLQLPKWFKHGLVYLTTEKYFKKRIIKNSSIETFAVNFSDFKRYDVQKSDISIVYEYLKGYWTVKYLEDKTSIDLLKEIVFENIKDDQDLLELVKSKFDFLSTSNSWSEIYEKVYNYFKTKL